MKYFTSIDKLSYSDCHHHLQKETDMETRQELQNRINEIKAEESRREERAFHNCHTISEFQQFISNYPSSQFKERALWNIDDLSFAIQKRTIARCKQYILNFPHGRHVQEAKNKIARHKKARAVGGIMACIIAVVCFFAYHPGGNVSITVLNPSDDSSTVSFPKEGGTQAFSFSANADDNNIEIESSEPWIKVTKINGGNAEIIVEKNEDDIREGVIRIVAYSTFFGTRTSYNIARLYVKQDSGYATYISVSTSEIEFSQYGGTNTISVSANGYWSINSNIDSWCSTSIDGNTITITAYENTDEDRSGYLQIKSGPEYSRIQIFQSGVPATHLSLSRDEIHVPIGGSGEGRIYPVNYYTDGKTIKAYTSCDWMTVYVSKSNERIEIGVASNPNPRRNGIVYVEASGYRASVVVHQQGKTESISLNRTSYTFGADSNYKYFDVSIDGDEEISAYGSHNWISCSVSSSRLRIDVDENPYSARSGTVTVTSGSQRTTMTINQKGYHQCPNCRNVFGISTGQVFVSNIFNVGWVQCGMCGGSGKVRDE